MLGRDRQGGGGGKEGQKGIIPGKKTKVQYQPGPLAENSVPGPLSDRLEMAHGKTVAEKAGSCDRGL